jgi:hypothetical protein
MLASCGINNYVTLWDLASGLWERKVWTDHETVHGTRFLVTSSHHDAMMCL